MHRAASPAAGLLKCCARVTAKRPAHGAQDRFFYFLSGCAEGNGALTPGAPRRGRHASSGYEVLEPLAAGGAALVRWRLRTGRTHQIRVHARHLGHPLLGDVAYGGAAGSAVTAIARGKPDRRAYWACSPAGALISPGSTTTCLVQWVAALRMRCRN